MSNSDHQAFVEQALSAYQANESPDESLVLADYFTEQGDFKMAATALDRAYGLNPDDPVVAERRQNLLDEFEIIEHGLRFRYVPAGTFLMGSDSGDHDELPVHPIRLEEFWVAETTVTWATYCDICEIEPPPGRPEANVVLSGHQERLSYSRLWGWQEEKLAKDDKARFLKEVIEPNQKFRCTADQNLSANRNLQHDGTPMVAVTAQHINQFLKKVQRPNVAYHLPSEQQWEKAARGGRIGQPYTWGQALPDMDTCDFGSLENFELQPSKSFAPNGYGLYAMCGGVWEWTSSTYDSQSYANPEAKPALPKTPWWSFNKKKSNENVLFRGGSWTDCAEAVTVSFRMTAETSGQGTQTRSPTFGFRIFRSEEA